MRPSHLGVVGLLLGSCSQPPPAAPTPASAAPPPVHVVTQREPLHGYRLAQSFVAKGPFRDGAPLRVGAIVNGLRVRPDASGLRIADSVALPALQGGVPVPDPLGGGFLFWNESALYTSDSFLGKLTPLLDIGFRPGVVSFGPSFALLRGSDGNRLAIDLRTRQRVPMVPPLLADVAVTTAGRSLSLLEGGACLLSEDAGKSYRPLALPVGSRAVSVREASGELFADLTSDQQIRVDSAGNVQIEPATRAASARVINDSLWPLAEPPLERALAFGVPIGEEFAGVAVAGSVATVNLRTGELVQVTRALVPSELSCRTLDANVALLLACNSKSNGSVVLSGVFGERPQTEGRFESGVRLDFAAGVLVASSRCDGQVQLGAVCVRDVDGRLHDYDVGARLAKLEHAPSVQASPTSDAEPAAKAPPIVRWIPKVGGGAVALIGGSSPGLLDAQTGTFVAISPEAVDLAGAGKQAQDWLGLDWVALADGSVRGWLADRALAIASDGRLEPSVYQFASLSAAGAHALAFDRGRRVFQTTDWGRTWVETLAPPAFAPERGPNLEPICSQVGCLLGPWLRVGWEVEVPAARLRSQRVAPAPVSVAREPLPILSCQQLGAPNVKEQAPPESESDARPWLGMSQASLAGEHDYQAAFVWSSVHPVNGMGAVFGSRASFAMRAPNESEATNLAGYSASARLSFVSPFEPNARIRATTLSWRALVDAARAAGVEPPSFEVQLVDELATVPVLGLTPGEAEGLVLASDWPIWLRGSGGAVPLSAPDSSDVTWISAVQRAPNRLALLGGHGGGTLEVVEFTAGRGRRLFQMPGSVARFPANPDALAISAHGDLAILRTASGSEPATTADPAALFHEDGRVSLLAPWSRLFLADAPECQPAANDYRAVLQTSRAWLQLIDAAAPVSDALQAGMFAMLRGNADRLCLEAVELAEAAVSRLESSHETRLAARFVGHGKGAARLGFDPGFEFRQGLDCSLSVAR